MKKEELVLFFLDLLLQEFEGIDIKSFEKEGGRDYDGLNLILDSWIQKGRYFDEEKVVLSLKKKRIPKANRVSWIKGRAEKEFNKLWLNWGPKVLSKKIKNR